jgi:hypothetical protein
LFDCQSVGLHAVKGIVSPVQVYHVLGESGTRSRFEVAVRTGLTPGEWPGFLDRIGKRLS